MWRWLLIGLALAPSAANADTDETDVFELSLEQLLQLEVSSVSRAPESRAEAPAHVHVISRAELRERGYRELSEIFDDLPGFDVTRPRGDNSFVAYWHGIRQQVGIPYLVMVDGLPLNHLFFNHAHVLPALPMRQIERVEVVYGPASVGYGPNALTGVVNIITRRAPAADGVQGEAMLSAGSFGTRIAELFASGRRGQGWWSLGARAAQSWFDDSHVDQYEYSRRDYLADPALWGDALAGSRYGGFDSRQRTRGLDLRLGHGDFEFGLQYLDYTGGYGVEYATDRVQPNAHWSEPEYAVHLHHQRQWRDDLSSRTLLRWRASDVAADSDFLQAANVSLPGQPLPVRLIDLSLWRVDTDSLLLQHDLEYRWSARSQWVAGFSAENKDLQRRFAARSGPRLAPADFDPALYPSPGEPAADEIPGNRVATRDRGIYLLGRYRLGALDDDRRHHTLHFGVRRDDHSGYGRTTSLRGGYVGQWSAWGLKLLYGEGFLEPPPSVAYSQTSAGQAIEPITTRTVQLDLSWTGAAASVTVDAYRLRSDGAFGGTRLDRFRLGDTVATGVDVFSEYRLAGPRLGKLKLWLYGSWMDVEQTRQASATVAVNEALGDMAEVKLWAGASWAPHEHWQLTLRARHVGSRPTVFSNPVGHIDSHAVADLAVLWRRPWRQPFDLQLSLLNLADTAYVTPGIRNANAGTTPGAFDASGVWRGSAASGNSLFPQEGRGLFLSVDYAFD